MEITPREKQRRQQMQQKRKQQRRLTAYAVLFVVLVAAAIVLIVKGVFLLPTDEGEPASDATTTVPTTTTTTVPYPTLPAAEAAAKVSTRGVLLYDATHDTVLYKAGASSSELYFPASLTKLLTAAVACDRIPPETVITVGDEITLVEWDASVAYLQQGTTMTLPELLDALLLESGADAAYCLAVNTARIASENDALSNEDAISLFMEYMNETAREIGAVNTHFVTPDGYHDLHHFTTMEDMLKIMLYADSFPLIHSVVASPSTGGYTNTNLLLQPDNDLYYPYAIGMKTGFTDEAGYCLAASAEKDGVRLYALLFGNEDGSARFADAKAMFEMGFDLAEQQNALTSASAQ